jgi:hypothetical protein
LREKITLDADRFLSRYTVCPSEVLGEIPAKAPVSILIGPFKYGFKLADIVNEGTISILHKPLVADYVLTFNFSKIAVNKKLFLAKLPRGRDITDIFYALNNFRLFYTKSVEETDKLNSLAGALSAAKLVLIGVV